MVSAMFSVQSSEFYVFLSIPFHEESEVLTENSFFLKWLNFSLLSGYKHTDTVLFM